MRYNYRKIGLKLNNVQTGEERDATEAPYHSFSWEQKKFSLRPIL